MDDRRPEGPARRMGLAIRELVASRPVRAVRALVMRAVDVARTPIERVRGLEGPVTVARDAFGVPGVFARSMPDLAFGMGWACAEDRLFQMELLRRTLRGELAATFGDRPVDERTTGRLLAGRTFVDLDAFTRAVDFKGAAEASWSITSAEGRAWVDAYAAGVNAYLASGRRPLEMLLLDLEPAPWTGVDPILIGKGMAFQLSFTWRFALSWALVAAAVEPNRAELLRPVHHPLGVTRGDVGAIEPLLATAEVLRAVLGVDGVHVGSNAFAVAPSRSTTGRAILASDPHMPLTAPSCFWEVRLQGGDLDVRGAAIPGLPAIPIGQNAHAAWGATAGWGDDTQIYREDLVRLRKEGRLHARREEIGIKNGGTRTIEVLTSPRGPIVSHVVGHELGLETDVGLALRWSGADATLDIDAALGLMRMRSFADLRRAVRDHGGPTLNFVYADDQGHIGWHYAGRIPKRPGLDRGDGRGDGRGEGGGDGLGDSGASGIDLLDGDDPRGAWNGFVPAEELPHVLDPKDGVIVSANTRPHGAEYRHALGDTFEPPFRKARIRALLDAYTKVGPREIMAIHRDVRSAWALQMRDLLLRDLDDDTLDLTERRGRDLIRLVRAWDGRAIEASTGAAATYVFLDAAIRHVFLEDLGDLAFDRYFDLMNVSALPLLQVFGDEASAWFEGRDRATIVRDAAAMAEGRLRRMIGEDPASWKWGALHTITFRHPFVDVPGLRAVSSPGPYPARGDGTTVCMGEYGLRGGGFAVRVAPAYRCVMVPGAPREGRAVLPPGESGDPASRHYRDQVGAYLAGELREVAWDETDFGGRRVRLVT